MPKPQNLVHCKWKSLFACISFRTCFKWICKSFITSAILIFTPAYGSRNKVL